MSLKRGRYDLVQVYLLIYDYKSKYHFVKSVILRNKNDFYSSNIHLKLISAVLFLTDLSP